jgi:hypothetical protein
VVLPSALPSSPTFFQITVSLMVEVGQVVSWHYDQQTE